LSIPYFRKKSPKLILIVLSLSFALIALEITLKFTAGKPWVNSHKYSQEFGWVNKPGTSGWYLSEGKSYIDINSYGFNDDETFLMKPKNIFRVAVIGDSYVEALQVDRISTFWKVLETKLNSNCNLKHKTFVEIIAFGVSGWGPAQELLLLQKLVLNFDPDLIMTLITTNNDIINSSPILETYKNRPFVSNKNNQIIWDYSFVETQNNILKADFKFIEELSIYKWVRFVTVLIKNRFLQIGNSTKVDPYLPPNSSQVLKDAWESTLIVLNKMHEIVNAKAKPIIFILGTNSEQLKNKELINRLGLNKNHKLYTPNNELIRFFKSEKILYIDLLAKLSGTNWKEEFRYLHGSSPKWTGHWNAQGHNIIAESLFSQVCYVIKMQNENTN
jgi:hypothetical protein